MTVPSYSAVRDGIRFLRWAEYSLPRRSVRATRVSRRRAHVRVFSRRLPAGSKAPRSAFTIGKERQMRRDRNWPWHVGDGADKREEPGRRAREKEGDRMTRTWSRTEGRDVTVPTSSYSHKPPHRPFSSSFLLRLLLILRRLLTDERGDSIISKLPKALKTTRQFRTR